MKVQQVTYPDYFDELRGIADGSKQDLVHVLLINLDEELSYYANGTDPGAALPLTRRRGVRCVEVVTTRFSCTLVAIMDHALIVVYAMNITVWSHAVATSLCVSALDGASALFSLYVCMRAVRPLL